MSLPDASDTVLTRLAAGGQRDAAGELLARRMPMLAAMARRITVPALDADDLLAEAISHLLSRWAVGDGPQDGIDAYLIRSMRNRVIDEGRSPRSKNVLLDQVAEPVVPEPADFHAVELHRELALVRTALARLPADQRRVLLATVVDGRKPGDLIQELARPAPAIHALNRRAKLGLQRALLQAILEESDDSACRKCSRELPSTINAFLPDDPTARSAEHLRDCEHCSKGWQRYLFLMACGGVSCLVLVAGLLAIPVAPAAAATVGAVSGVGAAAAVRPSGRRLALGITATVVGVALVGWGVWGVLNPSKPTASMNLSVTSPSSGRTDVDVAFSVNRTPWTIDDVTLVLPAGETLISAPAGWICRSTSPVAVACTVQGQNPRGGTLSFAGTGPEPATYQLVIRATADGIPVTGTAEGAFPR